jgi:hypothetical protein
MLPVRQDVPRAALPDAAAAVRTALAPRLAGLRAGARVAITAGSRGVHDYVTVLRAAGDAVRAAGGVPVAVPAMGSHAGGTPEGRREHLARLGVTPDAIGYDLADGPSVPLGATPAGVPVFVSAAARACDAIVILNRVKPHSNLAPPLGSGLRKMLAVGLSGPDGAAALHAAGMTEHLVAAAACGRAALPLLAGLALVEDGAGQLARVEAVAPADFDAADERLLTAADGFLPRLPFRALDGLFVQRMGKECSGVGMDPNVIGRARRLGTPEGPDDVIAIGRLAVAELTAATGGNALGIGMADVVTERLVARMDRGVTALNARTAGFHHGDRVPRVVPSDREGLEALCEGHAPEGVRLAVILDTAHLGRFLVSPALRAPALAAGCTLDGAAEPLRFDAEGRLTTRVATAP